MGLTLSTPGLVLSLIQTYIIIKLEEEDMQKKSEEEANQKQLEAGTRTRDQIMNWGSENLDLE